MAFGDMFLDQELMFDYEHVESHKIIRYMDDMYISIIFKEDVSNTVKEIYINTLASRISDCFYDKLGLRLNTKTRLFWLNDDKDVEELERNLKKVSPGNELPDDENEDEPNDKINRIIDQLDKLKQSSLEPTFSQRRDLDEEILKEIYDRSVIQLFGKPLNQAKLKRLFVDFNFDLVNAQPKEITIILLLDPTASENFKKYLLAKEYLTSRDIYLILTYLCQTSFESEELLLSLGKNSRMKPIVKMFNKKKIQSSRPGYFSLHEEKTLRIAKMDNVIEQIRLRAVAERRQDYSVALNHLLNELHAACYLMQSPKISEKNYDATNAVDYLKSQGVSHETCMKARNLFDRRNKSPVSHADPISWPVERDEYINYHKHVGICMEKIL